MANQTERGMIHPRIQEIRGATVAVEILNATGRTTSIVAQVVEPCMIIPDKGVFSVLRPIEASPGRGQMVVDHQTLMYGGREGRLSIPEGLREDLELMFNPPERKNHASKK